MGVPQENAYSRRSEGPKIRGSNDRKRSGGMATATGHSDLPQGTHPIPGTAGGPIPYPVDPAAPAGELLAVIGPAGPGRTSLLLALGGRMRLRGRSIEGGEARRPATAREVRRRVAVARAFGAAAPEPNDRVGELLELAGVYAGHRAGAPAVGKALGRAGLTVVEHPTSAEPGILARGARYEHLPAADQLLLVVALALVGEPEVLLVDAVDDGQDDTGSDRVWTRLRHITESGTTVIAASGSATTAGRYAHRTVLLPHSADDDDCHGHPVTA
jgi:ABC-2 type transport system ATP-binding protein